MLNAQMRIMSQIQEAGVSKTAYYISKRVLNNGCSINVRER